MKRQREGENAKAFHKDRRGGGGGGGGGNSGGGGDSSRKKAPNNSSGGSFYHQQQQLADAWSQRLHPRTLQGKSGVNYTVTLALPGSILRNAVTRELKTYIVGQIARAIVIHEVDEVVVFVDSAAEAAAPDPDRTPSVFFCRLLQYLECPSYLRRDLFPHHNDLSNVGLLPTLDTPHHMRQHDASLYREGVVVADRPSAEGCYVNVGLSSEAFLDKPLKPGVRVTVRLDDAEASVRDKRSATGSAVKPTLPRESHGLYWGYQTRLAKTFAEVFSACPYAGGYDYLIGHSDKGGRLEDCAAPVKKGFQHLLVVFGGTGGIEACVDADETLATKGKDADTLFDQWLDLCPSGGSRQVRVEEAVLAGLARLRPLVLAASR